MKSIVTRLMVLGVVALGLLGCHEKTNSNELRVGAMSGPESELVNVAAGVALKRYKLPVKIVTFDSYNIPNAALAEGSIDVNVFQHRPFLEAQIKARGYKLISVGKTFIYPMALYSTHVKSLAALPVQAKVAIPSDPSNEGRALLLLQSAGLIKLKPGVGFTATPLDVADNPKQLKIIALAAAQLPRSLDDVQLAAINTNFATLAGLSLKKDALFREPTDSPYANIIVVKAKDKDSKKVAEFVKAMQSQAVIDKAHEIFGENAIAAWGK